MVRRVLLFVLGAAVGVFAGSTAFYLTREHGALFSWFLPVVFAVVLAVVAGVAGERCLQALAEVIGGL